MSVPDVCGVPGLASLTTSDRVREEDSPAQHRGPFPAGAGARGHAGFGSGRSSLEARRQMLPWVMWHSMHTTS